MLVTSSSWISLIPYFFINSDLSMDGFGLSSCDNNSVSFSDDSGEFEISIEGFSFETSDSDSSISGSDLTISVTDFGIVLLADSVSAIFSGADSSSNICSLIGSIFLISGTSSLTVFSVSVCLTVSVSDNFFVSYRCVILSWNNIFLGF